MNGGIILTMHMWLELLDAHEYPMQAFFIFVTTHRIVRSYFYVVVISDKIVTILIILLNSNGQHDRSYLC